jgi:murein DD-endopeptidase MepM/ murein hydrolase activator NlpD
MKRIFLVITSYDVRSRGDFMNKELETIIKKNKYRSKFYQEVKPRKGSVQSVKPKLVKENKSEPEAHKMGLFLFKLLNQTLAAIIVLLALLITRYVPMLSKVNQYSTSHLNFAKIDQMVTKHFGGFFPVPEKDDLYVNDSIVSTGNTIAYKDGVLVHTEMSEAVQSHTSGIVIERYEDKELGLVIVIQNSKGYLYKYAMLDDVKVKLYSRIQYGEVLGLARVNEDYEGNYYLAIEQNHESVDVVKVINDEN